MTTVELLHGMMDLHGHSDFRFLSDNIIREVKIDASVYSTDEMYDREKLLSLLPPFPQGQWTRGRIFQDDNQQVQIEVDNESSPSNTVATWHPFRMHLISWDSQLPNHRLWMVEGPVLLGPPKFDSVRLTYEKSWITRRVRADQLQNNANNYVPCSFRGHVDKGSMKGYLLQMAADFTHLPSETRVYGQATVWLKEDVLSYNESQTIQILLLDEQVQVLSSSLLKHELKLRGSSPNQELGLGRE